MPDSDLVRASTDLRFDDGDGNVISDTTGWNDGQFQSDGFEYSFPGWDLGGGWDGGGWDGGGWDGGGWDGGGWDGGGWYGGGGGYYGGGGGYGGGGWGYPVVLDLTGGGINITTTTSSNKFYDMAGDGLQYRTAWAGAGNGVLVLDLSGVGDVNSPRSFQFTAWDPTAKTDLEALAHVFDTDHDGTLDADDARWSEFKILVTKADGTTELKTLSELGIQSISLTSDNSRTVLPDGSVIFGQATFTRIDGTTGAAADVALHYESQGYVIQQVTTTNADGSTTIDSKAYGTDGSLASETRSTTSADSLSKTLQFDSTGRGIFDRTQTDVTVVHADGSRTQTVSDFNVAGVLTDRTITSTSADRKTISISRDVDGNGSVDQTETRVIAADGSISLTVSDLNGDGSLKDRATTETSAGGLVKTVRTDLDGNGAFDLVQTDNIIVASNGERTETVSTLNADGSLRSRVTTTTGADGRSSTAQSDQDGNGIIDLTVVSVLAVNADGSTVTTQTERNGDGSLRDKTVTTLSADALSKTVQVDLDGNGTFDLQTATVSVKNGNGSTTETVTRTNADGSQRDQTVTTWSADGKTRTVQTDSDGDGTADRASSVIANADGSKVTAAVVYSANGTLQGRTVTTVSADGLSTTIQRDVTGDGNFDQVQTDVTVLNANGSRTETTSTFNADGSLKDRTVVTMSADGLSKTTQWDTTGAGTFNFSATDIVTANADGSQVETVSHYNANGSLRDRVTTTLSVNRLSRTVQTDANGDGHVDQTVSTVIGANGSTVQTVSNYGASGSLLDRTVTTISANGLSKTTQWDTTGTGVIERTRTDVAVLNIDGSRTETVTDVNANGSLRSRTITTVSPTGLVTTQQWDLNGDGISDGSRTDGTVINADGSRTETVSDFNGNGTLEQTKVQTISANGLSVITQIDANGDGVFDQKRSDTTVLNADGSTTEIVTDRHADNSLAAISTTTTSGNGKTISATRDTDGNGVFDQAMTTLVMANGSRVTTLTDFRTDGTLQDRLVTTVSADGLATTTQRDTTGSGTFDQVHTDATVVNPNGSRTQTIADFKADGSLKDKTVVTTGADGLSRTTQWDAAGAGSFNLTETDVVTTGADGGRTETLAHYLANGALKDRTTTINSADRLTTSVVSDLNGDGVAEQTVLTVANVDGAATTTASDYNANGTLKDRLITQRSANGLSTTTQRDVNGDGVIDQTRTDVVVLNTDGSKTETMTDYGVNGAVTSRSVTTISSSGLGSSTLWDLNGDGANDAGKTDVIQLNVDGSRTETVTQTSGSGAVTSRYVQTTSVNALSVTKQWDNDGNGSIDQTATDNTVLNADGSNTETLSAYNAAGGLRSRSVITTSADGRTRTTTSDVDGNGSADQTSVATQQTYADGSQVASTKGYGPGGGPTSISTVTTSGDGRTVKVSRDVDADGDSDQVETSVTLVDGSKVTTIDDFRASGALKSRATVSISADGLHVSTAWDFDGDGIVDRTRTDDSVVRADGSRVETIIDTNRNGALHQKGVLTTSGDGRTKTLQKDTIGGGYFDFTETTIVNVDGSSSTHVAHVNQSGALIDQSNVTVSADGLSKEVQTDTDGNGSYDYIETTTTNIDGSTITAGTHYNADGSVKGRVITTVSSDGLIKSIQIDSTNAGWFDSVETDLKKIDGSLIATRSYLNADRSVKSTVITSTSANGDSHLTTIQVGGRTIVDGSGNSGVLTEGIDSVYVDGTSNHLAISGGTITVAAGSSLTIEGSNDVVLAAPDAQISFVGNNNKIFWTQVDLAQGYSITAQNTGWSRTDTQFGFNYSEAGQATRVYYQGSKIPAVFSYDWAVRGYSAYQVPTVVPVFLNGTETIYAYSPEIYAGVSLTLQFLPLDNSAPVSMSAFPAIELDADGYIGFNGVYAQQGNWVLAEGGRPVDITGSNDLNAQDYLKGAGGNDIINGGLGLNDVLLGGGGNDTIYFDANSYGKSGDRKFLPVDNSGISLSYVPQAIDGGDGYDTGIITSTGSVNISLAGGNFEALISSVGDDYIVGSLNAEGYIDGGAGNDTIVGGTLGDILIGGDGNDTIYARAGADMLQGGAGSDALYGEDGADTLTGGGGGDVLSGGAGDDQLNGGAGNDWLDGGVGTDRVVFSGARRDYVVSFNAASQSYTVTDNRSGSPDGSDTVTGVELFAFADQTMTAADVLSSTTDATISVASISENTPSGSIIGTVAGVVLGAPGTLTYTLLDNAGGLFTISAGTGVLTLSAGRQVDYEAASSQSIVVRVANQFGQTFDKSFVISVLNVNEAPTGATLTANRVDENAANGTLIGSVVGVEPDAGQTLTYSLVNNAGGRFTINQHTGAITLTDASQLDHVAASQLGVVVRITDQDGLFVDRSFTIEVLPPNVAPTDISTSLSPLAENAQGGSVVAVLTTSDANLGEAFQYAIVGGASDKFAVVGSKLVVKAGAVIDYETDQNISVMIRVTDHGGLTYEKTFVVPVLDVNEAPISLVLDHATIAENAADGTVVGTAHAVDPDAGAVLSYSLIDSADGRFTVNGMNGVISIANGAKLDYENSPSHTIIVRATDQAGQYLDKTIVISVTDVNEAPTNVWITGGSVADNATSGAVVGKAVGADPDINDILSYALLDNAGGLFAINASTGAVIITDASLLSFGHSTNPQITVRATDAHGEIIDRVISINVYVAGIAGTAGNDTLVGTNDADRLVGGAGSDVLKGGAGNDTYLFSRGDGADSVYDDYRYDTTVTTWVTSGYTGQQWVASGYTTQQYVPVGYYWGDGYWYDEGSYYQNVWIDTSHYEPVWVDSSHYESSTVVVRADGGADVLSFGSGVTASDLVLGMSGNDLIVAVRDPANPNATLAQLTDRITIQNWMDPLNRIETFKFVDGTVLNVTQIVASLGTDGDDVFTWTESSATLSGGSGNDTLTTGAFNDTLNGGIGNDVLDAGVGDDVLNGGAGNDTLRGGSGNDMLDGGAGNDALRGGTGNDVYRFGLGDGNDTIDNSDGGTDRVQFKAGIAAADLTFAKVGNDLQVLIAGVSDTLSVTSWFLGAIYQVSSFVLSDGTVVPVQVSVLGTAGNDVLTGTASNNRMVGFAGNDTLNGGAGDDTLDGGAGNDALRGGTGNDVYLFGLGDGNDTIDNSEGGTDRVQFKAGIAAADLTFAKVGNDLQVLIAGVSDTLSVTNWFLGAGYQVSSFVLSDGTIVPVQVSVLGTAGNDVLTGTASGDRMVGLAGNDTLDGGAGDDTLSGGTGNDVLKGGAGNDTYLFSRGDGADSVYDDYRYDTTVTTWVTSGYTGQQWVASGYTTQQYVPVGYYWGDGYWYDEGSYYQNVWIDTSHYEPVWVDSSHYESSTVVVRADGGADVLSFGSGVTASDLVLGMSGNDLIVAVRDPANPNATLAQLTDRITIQNWMDPLNRIETFKFVDGTVLNVSSIAAFQNGGTNNDTLTGTSANDWLSGQDGNDIIVGAAGNDILVGGTGDDILTGGLGNDVLIGGVGYDVYNFGNGGGQDRIVNTDVVNANASGELVFGSGIGSNNLWLQRSNGDLVISVIGTQDSITIDGWYNGASSQLSEIKLSDGTMIEGGLDQLVQAMAIYSGSHAGFNAANVAQMPTDSSLQATIAASWHS